LSENIIIRNANIDDLDSIMTFINEEWRENHILSANKSFFCYEHVYQDKVNFIVATNRDMHIVGILGYIPTTINHPIIDLATVVWKVSSKKSSLGLGVRLLKYLFDKKEVRTVFSVGINTETISIYNYLDIFTSKLNHFVFLNYKYKNFAIAGIKNLKFVEYKSSKSKFSIRYLNRVSDLEKFDFNQFQDLIPFKNGEYFVKRYFNHPIYTYKILGIFNESNLESILVTREEKYNNSKILRIVDFFGNEQTLIELGLLMKDILISNNYEYVDFYNYGISEEIMGLAGFMKVDSEKNDYIIPNYFNPFVHKNIDIYFFANTSDVSKIRLFKADGDQDRPS
jgi:N-acetylglutamate synthase-like GNAT family acetyltransferase